MNLKKYKQTQKKLFSHLRAYPNTSPGTWLDYPTKIEYSAPAGRPLHCSLQPGVPLRLLQSWFPVQVFFINASVRLLTLQPLAGVTAPPVPFARPRHPTTGRPSKGGKGKFSKYAQLDFRLATTLEPPQGHGSTYVTFRDVGYFKLKRWRHNLSRRQVLVPCAAVGPISLTPLSWTAVITLLPSPSSLRHLRSVEERVQTKGKCYWLQVQPATAPSASFHFWVKWTDAGLISSFIGLNNFWRVPIRTNLLAIFR